jgi:hypothetical protein
VPKQEAEGPRFRHVRRHTTLQKLVFQEPRQAVDAPSETPVGRDEVEQRMSLDATDLTELLRLDPRIGEAGVEILALRLTVEGAHMSKYHWRFVAKVRLSATTPNFGLTLLLLDDLGLPLWNNGLGFTSTIDAGVRLVEGDAFLDDLPTEAQLVLNPNP